MQSPINHSFFVGHENIEDLILREWQTGRLPHAMIFYGQSGIGKETFAYRLARFLLSNPSQSVLDLTVCDTIIKQIAENNCFNLFKLEPNPEKKTQIIDVDQVRAVKASLYKTIEKNENRVVFIHPADTLNTNAANALLKMLEEPPERTYFILVTNVLESLLPTVISRCRLVRFSQLSESNLKKIASFFNKNPPLDLIQKASGSAGKLFKLLTHSSLIETLRQSKSNPSDLDGFLKNTDDETMRLVYDVLSDLANEKQDKTILQKIESIWSDYQNYDLDKATTLLLLWAEARDVL